MFPTWHLRSHRTYEEETGEEQVKEEDALMQITAAFTLSLCASHMVHLFSSAR